MHHKSWLDPLNILCLILKSPNEAAIGVISERPPGIRRFIDGRASLELRGGISSIFSTQVAVLPREPFTPYLHHTETAFRLNLKPHDIAT